MQLFLICYLLSVLLNEIPLYLHLADWLTATSPSDTNKKLEWGGKKIENDAKWPNLFIRL